VLGYASPQWSTSVLGLSFFNSAPMSCAQCPHQPRFRRPTLYKNTVNSGLRTTRYSFLSRRAVVCAVYDNASASVGSTSDASFVSALARSLIDRSSLACAGPITSRKPKINDRLRIFRVCISHCGVNSAIGILCDTSSVCEFTKIRSDVWFEIEVPRSGTTEEGGVHDGAPHDGVPKHVQCAEHGCIGDYQPAYR